MRRSTIIAVVTVLAIAGSVMATPLGTVTVQRDGYFTDGTITVWNDRYPSGQQAMGGIYNLTKSASTGQGAWIIADGEGHVKSFCVEIAQVTSSNSLVYDVVMPKDANDPMNTSVGPTGLIGQVKEDYLRELWGRYFATASADAAKAEVFSACVWEIVYEAGPNDWDVIDWDPTDANSDGMKGFKCTGTDSTTANTWLASLDGTGPKADLRAITHPDQQDYLVEVPEPVTMSLLVLGGIGVLLRRRRK